MVDSIFGKSSNPPGTIVRLKVSPPAVTNVSLGLTAGEKQLSDIVDIGSAVQERVQKIRKLDAYLRIWNSAIKFLSGQASRYTPQFSRVEVEFIKPEKSVKLDI